MAAALFAALLSAAPAGAGKGESGKPPATKPPATKPSAAGSNRAAALLVKGWDALEMVNYPAAEETFRQVLDASPTRPQRAEALFALGHLWQYRRPGADLDKARSHYKQVAEAFKDTPSGALALMALARLADAPAYEKDRLREEARLLYRRIIERYPGSFTADEGVLRLAMTYLEDYGDAASERTGQKLLDDHLRTHPGCFLATPMHTELGMLHHRRGDDRKAIEKWIAADAADARAAEAELTDEQRKLPLKRRLNRISQNRVMDPGTRASLYYRIANTAEKKLKDYALAVTWYERTVYEIVRDSRYYVSKVAAARCRKLAAKAGKQIPPHPLVGKEPRP